MTRIDTKEWRDLQYTIDQLLNSIRGSGHLIFSDVVWLWLWNHCISDKSAPISIGGPRRTQYPDSRQSDIMFVWSPTLYFNIHIHRFTVPSQQLDNNKSCFVYCCVFVFVIGKFTSWLTLFFSQPQRRLQVVIPAFVFDLSLYPTPSQPTSNRMLGNNISKWFNHALYTRTVRNWFFWWVLTDDCCPESRLHCNQVASHPLSVIFLFIYLLFLICTVLQERWQICLCICLKTQDWLV